MTGWVVITDALVYMCERGRGERGMCVFRRVISDTLKYISVEDVDILCQVVL